MDSNKIAEKGQVDKLVMLSLDDQEIGYLLHILKHRQLIHRYSRQISRRISK